MKKYTVKKGDTLSRIGAKYGVTVPELAKANGIINVNLIHVGQVLIIPGTDTATNQADIKSALDACIKAVDNLPEFKALCELM